MREFLKPVPSLGIKSSDIISSRNSKRAVSDIDKVGAKHYKEPVQTVIQLYVNGKAKKTTIEFESISSCIKSLTGCNKKSNICNKFIQRLKSKEFEGFAIENEPNSMWKIIEISGMTLDEYKEHKRNQKRQKAKDKNAENAENTQSDVNNTETKNSKRHKKVFKYTYNENQQFLAVIHERILVHVISSFRSTKCPGSSSTSVPALSNNVSSRFMWLLFLSRAGSG